MAKIIPCGNESLTHHMATRQHDCVVVMYTIDNKAMISFAS